MQTLLLTAAPACPAYMREYLYRNGELELTCFVDYDAPDPGTGYSGGAWLCHAYHAGIDIVDYLADGVIEAIEGAACCYFSGD